MQELKLKFRGLYSQPNPLGSIPDGGLERADNVVLDRDNVIESRRGFKIYNTTAGGGPTAIANSGGNAFNYSDHVLIHDPVTAKLYYDSIASPGAFAAYTGTVTAPSDSFGAGRVHGATQNRNFYCTASDGIRRITGFTGVTAANAGMAPGLDGQWTAPGTTLKTFMDANVTLGTDNIAIASHGFIHGQKVTLTSTGVVPSGLVAGTAYYVIVVDSGNIKLASSPANADAGTPVDITALNDGAATHTLTPAADDAAYAYRLVWGLKDVNGNLILGAPSQREIITNLSTDWRTTDTIWTIPSSITTSHFYQLYRTGPSATVNDEPDDELQLVAEGNPVAGDITAGVITISDSTPDELRGATLYTSPSQEGIEAANYSPPFAMDIALFKSVVFYANTRQRQSMFITLAAPGVMVNGDTVTIAGVVYTAAATENYSGANKDFKLYSTASISNDVEDTARSLVRVINRASSTTAVYAYYISGPDDAPGKIQIVNRTIAASGATFVAISSVGEAFIPPLPSSGTTYPSTDDETYNRIHLSKALQPEACPLLQYLSVGAANEPIRRIIALRDSVFVFKDDGIFRITGDGLGSFSVSLFDTTVKLIGIDTAVALSNQIYCFTTQGVCAVSDTGVAVVSRQIEPTLQQLYQSSDTAMYGIGYESERKYILMVPVSTALTVPAQMFVYNTFTNGWTRWDRAELFGIVSTLDDKLYLGSYDDNRFRQERKAFSESDYADDQYAVTITGSSGTTVSLASTASAVAGQTLVDSLGNQSLVESVDSATDITVSDTLSWSAAAATLYDPIACTIIYSPIHGGNPGIIKHFQECTLLVDQSGFETITAGFRSNFSQTFVTCELVPTGGSASTSTGTGFAWGQFAWGTTPWGAAGSGPTTTADMGVMRTYFPLQVRRALWTQIRLQNSEAFSSFGILGVSLIFEGISTKFRGSEAA